jgi:hypothetical protein
MNTIIDALEAHLLTVIEQEFIKAEPELQDAILGQVQATILKIDNWIQEKLQKTTGK